MDYGWVAFAALVILNLVWGVAWKPFINAYMAKKGERLATSEDLSRIRDEIKACTIVSEGIKSQIATGMWQQQMLWTSRKDAYVKLLEILDSMSTAYGAAALRAAAGSNEFVKAPDDVTRSLRSTLVQIDLLGSPKVHHAWSKYSQRTCPVSEQGIKPWSPSDLAQSFNAWKEFYEEVLEIARKDVLDSIS